MVTPKFEYLFKIKTAMKISLLFWTLMSLSFTLSAQSWNGIGAKVLTYRSGPVAIGTDYIPSIGDVAFQDISNYKLFVCGGILADEWLVPNTTWCDYVFQDDYELLPLEGVADHIAATGHLHRTPSAAEVEANGLQMKATTLNQQEKIEEIYLHLITLNERLKQVEQENANLHQTNALLQAQLNRSTYPVSPNN